MSIYDYSVKAADGKKVSLAKYKGKVLLIVNTATKCGFTPQYAGLEQLYKEYQAKGFEILDFPCNQFAEEAPGTDAENVTFCQINFGTEFETFAKVDVNGKNTDPLFKFLKSQKGGILGGSIKWNFTKFLVDKDGNVVKRFASNVEPKNIEEDIKKLL